MEQWIQHATERGLIVEVDKENPAEREGALYGVSVSDHPWYEGGVAFDWSPLHSMLKASAVYQPSASLDNVAEGSVLTSMEIVRPWEMCPLNVAASKMSCFLEKRNEPNSRLFRFVKGGRGEQTARADIARVLHGVAAQLSAGGLDARIDLSTIVIVGQSTGNAFDTLLKQTGAAYRALKDAGLAIDAAQSNLEPRAVISYGNNRWSTLDYRSLKDDDVPGFLVDALYCWLDDRCAWRCEAPLAATAEAIHREFMRLLAAVARNPGVVTVTLTVDVQRRQLVDAAAPLLVSRAAAPPGQRRWSRLELRRFVHLVGLDQ
ncbi:Hypothetical protein, putative [Bodo saltans]|uniref:Uncharacterized protein n=1 Tax=Bodo saltans TaxID=75058 RepID=A0A0S4JR94_BODSA|nr:Hypothetical protein, putative [Bodo saltans]|eukprot:CUG91902.1 Hypothetical protein, putative [Bodo saltans]